MAVWECSLREKLVKGQIKNSQAEKISGWRSRARVPERKMH